MQIVHKYSRSAFYRSATNRIWAGDFLILRDLSAFFTNRRTTSRRCRLHVWSYLTPREVEVKDASTSAVLFDSSESIIDAICSHTRGSFSIS